ncbi:hypothetical protein WJX73_002080 [Symbiochloris irregularis]|uniref:Uncharacterized protein n=1 Tax=Symbiochloris irregularis TaxID=706552 RepID=A0AAW1PV26_9CHLO
MHSWCKYEEGPGRGTQSASSANHRPVGGLETSSPASTVTGVQLPVRDGQLNAEVCQRIVHEQASEDPQTPTHAKAQTWGPPPVAPDAPRKAGKWHRPLSPTAPIRRLDFDNHGALPASGSGLQTRPPD